MAQRQNSKSLSFKKRRPAPSNMVIGVHPVLEAVKAGKSIDKLFIQKGLKSTQIVDLLKKVADRNIYVQRVPIEKLNRLTNKVHQGVVCFVSPIDFVELENLVPQLFEKGTHPLILILDRITDVRNFGAITRTAECFGVDAVVIPQSESAQINEDTVKTSAGAIFNINISKEKNLLDVLDYLNSCGFSLVALTEKSKTGFETIDVCTPLALIMGSEGEGIHSSLIKKCDEQVAIPIVGKTASLNVSVATGVALFEVNRFRSLNNC